MADVSWIAIGRHAGAFQAFAFDGGDVTARASRATEADAISALDAETDTIIHIGEGPPDAVPSALLPSGGQNLPAITQDQPPGVLGGWPRLWIAGYLAGHDNWDGVICVAEGDVTHWVHVSANEVVSFASFLTLRLIRVLSGGDTPDPQAVADSLSRPERLAAHLREAEVTGRPATTTGHLLGAELAAARVYWLGQQLALIGPKAALSPHASALTLQEVPFVAHTPDELIRDGLLALAQNLGMVSQGSA
ncbi:2-dehydro-3-deoxygalactonokinase [uncultured Roseovarius sp.]|uniref:2-dehydro-3-deoxygalactonokinase n=1 Tax=uncultured Roseovarius sp. TaxID=293344 RepID=UPI0026296B79|nr:2-dehydro-3-deoxygalactonokinase [uncultured Roseovarius sp.]